MSKLHFPRRSFLEWLFALPFGLAAQVRPSPTPAVMKVAAGTDRFNDVRKLPGGDLLYVKVATQDTGGAFFMTEQPIERRGVGPPKHYHESQDEWFYCLAGGHSSTHSRLMRMRRPTQKWRMGVTPETLPLITFEKVRLGNLQVGGRLLQRHHRQLFFRFEHVRRFAQVQTKKPSLIGDN